LQRLVGENEQTILATYVLPAIFGDRFGRKGIPTCNLTLADLERLVRVAFRTIRIEEDNERANGEVFSPDSRDDAEGARSNLFEQMVRVPGRATFDAIMRCSMVEGFPIPKKHLEHLARERAGFDAEAAPWRATDLLAFEITAETAPTTGKDLKHLVMRRVVDIQKDLLDGDFAQGETLRSLATEADVQNWTADRLRLLQGRSFSVEREPHVVEENEPDIRVRAKASDACVAIEIKVAESWTLFDLEAALRDQLCGKYLRAGDAPHGILLLVYQNSRPVGWKSGGMNQHLSFPEVVVRLQELAEEISSDGSNGPQPAIAVLDVSTCTARHGRNRGSSGTKKARR
jgi:hypothetical protein